MGRPHQLLFPVSESNSDLTCTGGKPVAIPEILVALFPDIHWHKVRVYTPLQSSLLLFSGVVLKLNCQGL